MREDPKTVCCIFERTYELGRSSVVRELERSVLGCDYGGTSWTTREQADQTVERLSLRPGVQLLEVGAGAGWPGLYLARRSGCDATLTDVPLAGARAAIERAADEGLAERCRIVAADGARLPFRSGVFDAVSHSDVLCCMPAKLEMLSECSRVAKQGAKMELSVIEIVDGLSDAERGMAIEAGPPFVETADDYGALLARSGWRVLDRTDVTPSFAASARALVDGMNARSEALIGVLGSDDYAERMSRRSAALVALERGVLKREVFLTVKESR